MGNLCSYQCNDKHIEAVAEEYPKDNLVGNNDVPVKMKGKEKAELAEKQIGNIREMENSEDSKEEYERIKLAEEIKEPYISRDLEEEFYSMIRSLKPENENVRLKREELGDFAFNQKSSIEELDFVTNQQLDNGELYNGFMYFHIL